MAVGQTSVLRLGHQTATWPWQVPGSACVSVSSSAKQEGRCVPLGGSGKHLGGQDGEGLWATSRFKVKQLGCLRMNDTAPRPRRLLALTRVNAPDPMGLTPTKPHAPLLPFVQAPTAHLPIPPPASPHPCQPQVEPQPLPRPHGHCTFFGGEGIFFFLQPHLWHMEVSRVWVESEL